MSEVAGGPCQPELDFWQPKQAAAALHDNLKGTAVWGSSSEQLPITLARHDTALIALAKLSQAAILALAPLTSLCETLTRLQTA